MRGRRSAPMTYDNDLRQGALYMTVSALLFAAMALAVKVASRGLPNAEVVFFRNLLGLGVLLPLMLPLSARGLATRHLAEHLVRALAGLGAMYCFFYAIGHMRVADAVLLNYSLPLFMPLIAWAWLKEPVPRRLWWALGVGFVGLLLILKPGLSLFNPVALFGVAAAMLAALAQVGIRRLTRTEPVTRIVFYFGVIATAVSAVPLAGVWRPPDATQWQVLLALGVLATLAQLALTRAYAHAPAAQVGPFLYMVVVFTTLLEGWYFEVWPDPLSIAGAVLVCTAGILTLRWMDG